MDPTAIFTLSVVALLFVWLCQAFLLRAYRVGRRLARAKCGLTQFHSMNAKNRLDPDADMPPLLQSDVQNCAGEDLPCH